MLNRCPRASNTQRGVCVLLTVCNAKHMSHARIGDELAVVCINQEKDNVYNFRAAVERMAQSLADVEHIIVHPDQDDIEVPTFLRIGVAHTWQEADYMETEVRKQIYLAAFGSLNARGALVAKGDPLISDLPTFKIAWLGESHLPPPGQAQSISEVEA